MILLFIPVGIVAGILGTVTGLASLASYPALLYFAGLPAVSANVVNKAALMFNSIGSAVSSTQELRGHWKELFKTMLIIFFGGITGAILLTALPSSSFTHIVPVFIAAGGIMILIPSKQEANHEGANNFEPKKGQVNQHSWLKNILIVVLVYLIGAYSGYFGAASGILLLVLLTRTSSNEYTVSNAIRNVAMGAANIVATVYYAFMAHIVWILVLPLGIGFFIGGYIGPKIVRVLPVKYIRITTGVLALILAYTQFSSAYNVKIFGIF
ncbi:sulfite exporter TauE/SafE family protein [Apilactobacillus apisilvae]|uniref:Probable membrane transporter protein n=1 Tax=Apilactobacillus apisilvae TaxID=2923364 RepID=A0ABY4PGE7_9LACO|nr:sulfite exporter TauE/SafE family protein [Apilactobacillus apisilvae]UQS84630.1 sulfite exporter TauE/SafE family protein [Apilactobacillus apisilvae]